MNAQLHEALERAITLAQARGWAFFISVRYPGHSDLDFFSVAVPAQLREFLEGCARHAFPLFDRDQRLPTLVLNFEGIGDIEMRTAIARAVGVADKLRCWFFCAFLVPPAGGRVNSSSIFECGTCALLLPDLYKHLELCFRVAMAACGAFDACN